MIVSKVLIKINSFEQKWEKKQKWVKSSINSEVLDNLILDNIIVCILLEILPLIKNCFFKKNYHHNS